MADLDLARELVAAPGWEWPTPCVAIDADGRRWLVYEGDGGLVCGQGIGHRGWIAGWATTVPILLPGVAPDLDDPATAGVLVEMLREAVPGWTVEILMLRAHVEVCVGSAAIGRRTVYVGASLGRAAARAWLAVL